MLIQYIHYPTNYKTQFFHTLFQKKKKKKKKKGKQKAYFKGLPMTHHWDIFMSGKKLGLNGLNLKNLIMRTRV